MPEVNRKARYFASHNLQRTRDVQGKARRIPSSRQP